MTAIQATPHANSTHRPNVVRARAVGPLGTIARTLIGIALLALGIVGGGDWIVWWQLALGLIGLPAAVVAAQLARLTFTSEQLNQTSRLAFCLNCAAVAGLLTAAATRDAMLVFLGSSMLLAVVRGYGGCETLAISNWLLRRDDQVGCLVFAPLDQFEARRLAEPA